MSRIIDNKEEYTPPRTMGENNYMRDDGQAQINSLGESYNEKVLDLHFNLSNLPANVKYQEQDEIIPNIKKGINLTNLLVLNVDETENEEFSVNNFLIKDEITSFISNIPLSYDTLKIEQVGGNISITTPNILDISKEEALTDLNLTELTSGNYILHLVINNLTDTSIIRINNKEYTYNIDKVEAEFTLNNITELDIQCTNCYMTEVSLIPYVTINNEVYYINNETYNPKLKITDYDKENIELTKYEGFIKPSFNMEV